MAHLFGQYRSSASNQRPAPDGRRSGIRLAGCGSRRPGLTPWCAGRVDSSGTRGAAAATGVTASTARPHHRLRPPALQVSDGMQRIWPDHAAVDDAGLFDAYAVDRSAGAQLRMNFVCSLDGAVEVDGYSRGLSNEDDQKVLHVLRVLADAVMVGAGTLRHEGYGPIRLSDRDHAARGVLAPDPTLVVVSASLALDPADKAFALAPVRPVVCPL